jgi:hypothetical protein
MPENAKQARHFSVATVAASSTRWGSVKRRRASSNNSWGASAGVRVIASASASATRSLAAKRPLSVPRSGSRVRSTGTPARLPPAALLSLQNGQPTSCSAHRQTSERSPSGRRPLRAPRAGRSGPAVRRADPGPLRCSERRRRRATAPDLRPDPGRPDQRAVTRPLPARASPSRAVQGVASFRSPTDPTTGADGRQTPHRRKVEPTRPGVVRRRRGGPLPTRACTWQPTA